MAFGTQTKTRGGTMTQPGTGEVWDQESQEALCNNLDRALNVADDLATLAQQVGVPKSRLNDIFREHGYSISRTGPTTVGMTGNGRTARGRPATTANGRGRSPTGRRGG